MKTTVTLEMMQHDEVLMREFTDQAIEALYEFYTVLEYYSSKDIEYNPLTITYDWTEYGNKSEACEKLGKSWEEIEDTTSTIINDNVVLVETY